MENPYQAPQSDVGKGIAEPKTKRGWRIFFWLMLGMQIISIVAMLFEPDVVVTEWILNLLVYPVVFIGLFAYAYDKRILNVGFWKPFLFVAIVGDLYSMWSLYQEGLGFESELEMLVVLGVTAVIVLPLLYFQYLGLYRYGYNAPEIWDDNR